MVTRFEIGNVLTVLREYTPCYFDGLLSDAPYELGLMGNQWDKSGIAFNAELWQEIYRVLKPGAYLLVFGGARTFNRLTCAIEDAGFEVRDHLLWLYGSGMVKGRANLKPAHEPIVLARKPGGRYRPLNLELCRIGDDTIERGRYGRSKKSGNFGLKPTYTRRAVAGRLPANVIVDDSAPTLLGDKAKYFYCAKASKKERNAGLDHWPNTHTAHQRWRDWDYHRETVHHNDHPCVKPLDLCRHLARLIWMENGRLLVPFSGTGSEVIGAVLEHWREVIGIEHNARYVRMAEDRLRYWVEREKTQACSKNPRLWGRIGGMSKSMRKAAAARLNGRKGGRPRLSNA